MALDRNLYVGKVLDGGYRIERFVGSGAFAYVYFAKSPDGMPCAVKVQYNLVDDARIRFAREIKVLKSLPPNDYLVRYYADGMMPEGYPYLIMEFVDGITLKESLKQRRVWPVQESCEFMLQLCRAFGGLHEDGIAHRDVKPDNIMITHNHQVKLMDLGLIKDSQALLKLYESEDILSGRDFEANLDKGVLAGTPEYMAPEQFSDPSVEDESKMKTDTWTDVYSLGLIFYEMLAGHKLFPFTPNNSSSAEYARSLLAYLKQRTSQQDMAIRPPQGCPYQLWTVIAKSLHADTSLRQLNASQFAEDIQQYLTTGEGVVESDSDKTSAIDLSNFAEVLRNTPSKDSVKQPPVSSSPEIAAVNQNAFDKDRVMPGVPPYANSEFPAEGESEDDSWLWIIAIGLLLVVVFILIFIIFVL